MAKAPTHVKIERLLGRLKRIPLAVKIAADAEAKLQADAMATQMRQRIRVLTGVAQSTIRVERKRRYGVPQPGMYWVRAGGPRTQVPVRKGSNVKFDRVRALEHGLKRRTSRSPITGKSKRVKRRKLPGSDRYPFFYVVWRARIPGARAAIGRTIRAVARQS
jgi:hypothetical protein